MFHWSLFYSQWWQLFCFPAQVGGSVDVIVMVISTKKCHTHQLLLTVQLTRQTTFWPLTNPVVSCHDVNENIRHQRKSKLHHLGNDLFPVSTFLYSNIVQRQSHAYPEVQPMNSQTATSPTTWNLHYDHTEGDPVSADYLRAEENATCLRLTKIIPCGVLWSGQGKVSTFHIGDLRRSQAPSVAACWQLSIHL